MVPLKCISLTAAFLLAFWLNSYVLEAVLRTSFSRIPERIFFGFFGYFFVFELLAVPMILMKKPFHLLVSVWPVAAAVIAAAGLIIFLYRLIRYERQPRAASSTEIRAATVAVIILVTAAAAFSAIQMYNGWDTSFYVGTMNNTLATDTMYLYDGDTGAVCKDIDFHYALSGFYMQFTVWAKWLGLAARTTAFWVIRPLCVILASMVVWMLGFSLFRKKRRLGAALVTVLWLLISFFWRNNFSTGEFLFVRGYEAKGYCANVVLPAALYAATAILLALQDKNQEETANAWKKLLIVSWASVPVSMSAMVSLPAGIAILGIIVIVRYGKPLSNIGRCLLCMLFNLLIIGVYILRLKNVLMIPGIQ